MARTTRLLVALVLPGLIVAHVAAEEPSPGSAAEGAADASVPHETTDSAADVEVAITRQHELPKIVSLERQAELAEQQGEYATAKAKRAEALVLWEQLEGKENWKTIDARLRSMTGEQRQRLLEAEQQNGRLGELYSSGRIAEAVELASRVAAIRRELLGEQHPDYASSLNNLAWLYHSMDNRVLAEPLFKQALVIRKQALGEQHPDYTSNLNSLAALYKSMGDYRRAELLLEQSLAIRKQTLGKHHSDDAGKHQRIQCSP